MRYDNDDQAAEPDIEAARKRSQLWIQLSIMPKRDLVALHHRMMRARGAVTLLGGPTTVSDYVTAIMCMERQTEADAAHLAAAGPGHERCPSISYVHTCKPDEPGSTDPGPGGLS